MNITDLSFDCLESCLQHLVIADLLNIADCNEQLRHAARYLIERIIKGREVKLNVNDKMFTDPKRKFALGKNCVFMGCDLKSCLQFFRCCGDLVSGMDISTCQQTNSIAWDQVLNYVNKYCSEFLIQMEFSHCRRGTLRGLTTPFRKVEQIEIIDSRLTDMKLSELFPNLHKIKFTWRHCSREVPFPKDFFTDHYPRLEHLSIFVAGREKDCRNVSILLRANPQLKSFSSNIDIQTIFGEKKNFPYASEFLQNLEKLDLDEIDCHDAIDERINLRSLKELTLCIRAPRESMWIFPFVCDQLESLNITVFPENAENGEDFLSRITNYPKNLKKIIIDSSTINHMEISKVLPLLEEIDLTCYDFYFTVDQIVHFVRGFRSLKLLKLHSLPNISTKELATRFRNDWSVSFESSYTCNVLSLEKSEFLSIQLERYPG